MSNSLSLTRIWRRRAADICVSVAILLFMSSTAAFAYVDPGSGGVIITAILGFIGAVTYTMRKHFYKIRRMLFGKKDMDDDDEDD